MARALLPRLLLYTLSLLRMLLCTPTLLLVLGLRLLLLLLRLLL